MAGVSYGELRGEFEMFLGGLRWVRDVESECVSLRCDGAAWRFEVEYVDGFSASEGRVEGLVKGELYSEFVERRGVVWVSVVSVCC